MGPVMPSLYTGEMIRTQQYGDGRGHLTLVLDCSDLDRSARFWTATLGYDEREDGGGGAGGDDGGGAGGDGDGDGHSNPYRSLVPVGGQGIELLLQRVPEKKGEKNRLHLDLRTRDLQGELQRVRALGATVVTQDPIEEDGWVWYVLADPDGNELCVVRPPEDYWSASSS